MVYSKIFGQSPIIDLEVELKRQKQLLEAIQAGLVQSAHDVAEGGLAVAIAESAIGAKGLGATVKFDGEATAALFAESQSRFVVTVKREQQEAFEKSVEAIQVGEVTNTNEVTIHNEENEVLLTANVDEMRKAWKGAIPCLLK
jgi:phosphoribosylformylglycinamidine synthase